jgi:hypothetical protein
MTRRCTPFTSTGAPSRVVNTDMARRWRCSSLPLVSIGRINPNRVAYEKYIGLWPDQRRIAAISPDGAAFANNFRHRLAVDPRCGGCGRDRRGRYRPVNGRFFSGGSAPLPVVRRSAGRSFATDRCFRLRRKRAHSVGLALPPASGGDANSGTSLRTSTSLIRRSPLRLHESNRSR